MGGDGRRWRGRGGDGRPAAAAGADGGRRRWRKAEAATGSGHSRRTDKEVAAAMQSAAAPAAAVQPTVRTNFADTAFWAAALTTDTDGIAEVELAMPENLTDLEGQGLGAWATAPRSARARPRSSPPRTCSSACRRPRFFVQKDEVVLSANVHNYLKTGKPVQVVLELDGGTLEPLDEPVADGRDRRRRRAARRLARQGRRTRARPSSA